MFGCMCQTLSYFNFQFLTFQFSYIVYYICKCIILEKKESEEEIRLVFGYMWWRGKYLLGVSLIH